VAIEAAVRELTDDLAAFDAEIVAATNAIPDDVRKLVVYHDAWEYFGRRYDYRVVGALQAVNFAEPSAAEVARMARQIREEGVPAFFGSEVFPSDVMEALEAESGARYVPDLADDALPGAPGDDEHTYLGMMRRNLVIITESLRP
jgi:ABC-type Zn uptake system ZnuABC Zn-binding protein ZnuA